MTKKIKRKYSSNGTRRLFTKEFKQEAVSLLVNSGKSAEEIGKSLGVSGALLGKWKREFEELPEQAFRGNGNRTSVEQELHEAKLKIKQLEQERDILKKAAAYFARNLE